MAKPPKLVVAWQRDDGSTELVSQDEFARRKRERAAETERFLERHVERVLTYDEAKIEALIEADVARQAGQVAKKQRSRRDWLALADEVRKAHPDWKRKTQIAAEIEKRLKRDGIKAKASTIRRYI